MLLGFELVRHSLSSYLFSPEGDGLVSVGHDQTNFGENLFLPNGFFFFSKNIKNFFVSYNELSCAKRSMFCPTMYEAKTMMYRLLEVLHFQKFDVN